MAYMWNRVILKGKSRLNDWDRSKEDLINELVELRRQVALLRNLAGSEKEMCCQTLDDEGRIIDINKAWTDLLGFTGADVYGRQFREFVRPGYADLFSSQFLYPVVNGENPDVELEMLHRDGSRLNVLLSGTSVYDNEGSFIGVYCILYDVTGRKRVEEALGAERRRLYSVLDELPAIVYLQAPDYTIPFANRLFREQYGSPEGRYCYEVIHGLGGPCEECLTFLPFKTQRPQVWETVKPSGRVLQIYDYPFYDIDGSPLVLELGIDITERKKAEEMLRSAYRRFQEIIDFLPDATLVIDGESRVIAWNRAMEEMTGIKKDEIIGRGDYAYAVPFYGKPRPMLIDLVGSDGLETESLYSHIEKKGNFLYTESYAANVYNGRGAYVNVMASGFFDSEGNKTWAIECIREISRQKEAEEALRAAEEKYRTVVENANEVIFVVQDGAFKFGNSKAYNFAGCAKEEHHSGHFLDLLHPDDRQILLERHVRRLRGEELPSTYPYRLIDSEGKTRWINLCSVSISWEGRPAILCFANDITERRRAEEALRESEEKYRTILDNIEDGYFEVDISGNLIFLNNSVGKISGYRFQELIGANYRKFTPPDVVSRLFKVFNKIFETGIPEKLFDWEIIKKDGSRGYLEASVSPIKDSEGKIDGFRSVARDVTERKRAEDQLRFLSLHDPLTGLYNRAYFEQEMHRLSGGRLDPVGIIMCDVDGLKLVNDTLGHEAGDRLLKGAAKAIKMSFRSSDVVSRIGGDEFAVLLPNSGRADIESAVGRIREAVSDLNSANPDLPLSLSLGFAVNENNSDLDSLFREADNNMYREKLHSRQSARSAIVMTLMKAMEVRDFVTEGHAERMQGLVAGLAKEMGLPEYRVTNMRLLAQFHDIGKVGIPDLILFKPGPLTSKEKNDMQRHCEIGHRIAQSLPDMASIADWILKHHEWWNGCGYPLGLRGEDIPLECRMLAITDAYDAMTSDRPYRKARSREEALGELERNAGTQFDPQLVPVFIRLLEKQAGK